ncbi:hypothetical protein [Aurantiacibacter gilvus]|uniref:Uncharacterized protein n=1 Tax=Aurantiacibacter gilvus TaxID=3139141 RepID=A0ABU9IDV1_9SPHN
MEIRHFVADEPLRRRATDLDRTAKPMEPQPLSAVIDPTAQ